MGPGGEAIRQLRTWSWGRRYLPSIRLASARTATKEEDIREIAGPSVRDAAWNEQKERREDDVHGEIKAKEGRKELRPSERDGEAIGITQIDARNALLLEFVRAKRNARRLLAGRAPDGKAKKRPVSPPPIRLLPIAAPLPLHLSKLVALRRGHS